MQKKDIKILCNLDSVATDPDAIKALMSQGYKVMSWSKLHAKVIIGDDMAILGSANMTGRGLGVTPCHNEEVVLFVEGKGASESDLMGECKEWFNQSFEMGHKPSGAELKRAKVNFDRNKYTIYPQPGFAGAVTDLVSGSELDKWNLLVCTIDKETPAAKEKRKKVARECGENDNLFTSYTDIENDKIEQGSNIIGCLFDVSTNECSFPYKESYCAKTYKGKHPVTIGRIFKKSSGLTDIMERECSKGSKLYKLIRTEAKKDRQNTRPISLRKIMAKYSEI